MKKKLIAALLASASLFSAVPAVMADNDKVEISFRVGDSILNINGTPTEVETPYVAGEGVTLVPLRVITEAFGAEVNWEGETKTITLTYPGVSIILQIGNIIAQVNDHSETLLEAPALSANGVTMVPLRFISETFGATVGYDSETSAILVTKEIIDDTNTVTGITEMERTGDSYYKWSIDTPKQMRMAERSLDGLVTIFDAGQYSDFGVIVYHVTDETKPFDNTFAQIKESLSGYTLTKADKLTDSAGNQYGHFQAKDGIRTIDVRHYRTLDYMYDVISNINADDGDSVRDMILSAADSFRVGATDDKTYDLSTVMDINGRKYRKITSDKYKLSFVVPAHYEQAERNGSENELLFVDGSDKVVNKYVSFGIYSKSSEVTATRLAEQDHEQKVSLFNPDMAKVSDITDIGNGRYQYTYTISGSENDDSYCADTFFENGEYVYNIAVHLGAKDDKGIADAVLNSLETETLDFNEVGSILRNTPDDLTISTVKFGDYSFELPISWKQISVSGVSSASYLNTVTGSILAVEVISDQKYTANDISRIAAEMKNSISEREDCTIVQNVQQETINGNKYSSFTYSAKSDGRIGYITTYMGEMNGKLVVFILSEGDVYYNAANKKTLFNAINTLKKN